MDKQDETVDRCTRIHAPWTKWRLCVGAETKYMPIVMAGLTTEGAIKAGILMPAQCKSAGGIIVFRVLNGAN
jgi:hypothetical protein